MCSLWFCITYKLFLIFFVFVVRGAKVDTTVIHLVTMCAIRMQLRLRMRLQLRLHTCQWYSSAVVTCTRAREVSLARPAVGTQDLAQKGYVQFRPVVHVCESPSLHASRATYT